MALRIYNTKTRRTEPFVSLTPGVVRMYVCGPSVYGPAHIGHARSYVVFDALRRILECAGYEVRHVQNFTDISEKIGELAAREGLTPRAFADRFIHDFFEDMDALAVARADHYPRVTDFIGKVVEVTRRLVESGHAYVGGRDVYFDVGRKKDFGKVAGFTDLDEVTTDKPARPAGGRRDARDFALWRVTDDFKLAWQSPWGEGRPGWHTECAVMAMHYLGPTIDIQGGGMDLVFPHHESSTAIAEASTGHEFCRTYVHNGFVTVDRRKMSKSLGNFVTLREARTKNDPEALRFFLLRKHYREPVNYTQAEVRKLAEDLARLRTVKATLAKEWRDAVHGPPRKEHLPEGLASLWGEFVEAIDDDLHFGRATDAVVEMGKVLERDLGSASLAPEARRESARILGEVTCRLGILGPQEARDGTAGPTASGSTAERK